MWEIIAVVFATAFVILLASPKFKLNDARVSKYNQKLTRARFKIKAKKTALQKPLTWWTRQVIRFTVW